ncbi:glycoside hydrolase family 99-like domain-containing protein [Duganella hordei]|uniref:glycoside hydrolase family 99-like domain-containing protein n=1 Tax=Duganella hordei TaxID=2865934 RepID=UPI0030EA7D26
MNLTQLYYRKISRSLLKVFALLVLSIAFLPPSYAANDFKIGVYYFPGWKDNQMGGPFPYPWEKIKPFPEREPMLGWYAEGDIPVMEKQLGWMNQYGIDYVVFDWYWGSDNKTHLDHALNAYLRAKDRHDVQFAIMWTSHSDYMFSLEQFKTIFQFWADRYGFRKEYLRVDGKPVVFIFSAGLLNKNAAKLGMTTAQLLAIGDQIFKDAGLGGVSFIGGVSNGPNGVDYSRQSGWTGFSSYNLHGPALKRFAGGRQQTRSYAELAQGYDDQWQYMLSHVEGIYVVPMLSGWDHRPWGASPDPMHDMSIADPVQFQKHLEAARAVMLSEPEKTKKMGVICCWNEFGEGSFIEPTKKFGFSYLEKVKQVFGTQK